MNMQIFQKLRLSRQLKVILPLIILILVTAMVAKIVFDNSNRPASEQFDTSHIPQVLLNQFEKTDWGRTDPSIEKAISGGPGRDGIPAIDNPKFVPLEDFDGLDTVRSIVVEDGDSRKVYPYNILTWHEIVNDSANGVPIAITFCPLCGSAIVYERTLNGEPTTFGVSGALIESNMIMYDRQSESFWQQSTGKSIAGRHLDQELVRVKFQLMTIGESKAKYPTALVLSNDTGYSRDYSRNPYSGYEDDESFIFGPSQVDKRYPSKTIFVVYQIENISVATPWAELKDDSIYETEISGRKISLIKEDGELTVSDESGVSIPFYFEMWFSWAVQNQETGVVFDPGDVN